MKESASLYALSGNAHEIIFHVPFCGDKIFIDKLELMHVGTTDIDTIVNSKIFISFGELNTKDSVFDDIPLKATKMAQNTILLENDVMKIYDTHARSDAIYFPIYVHIVSTGAIQSYGDLRLNFSYERTDA